jgi:hypothetical protein
MSALPRERDIDIGVNRSIIEPTKRRLSVLHVSLGNGDRELSVDLSAEVLAVDDSSVSA